MAKVTYQESINYLVQQVGVSEHQARQTIKLIGFIYQEKLKEGYDIECEPLFTVKYQVRGHLIYRNSVFTLEDVEKEIIKQLPHYSEAMTRILIETYIKYLVESFERGMTVAIKGVVTILVKEDEQGRVHVTGRMSPQLEKTEAADFMVMGQGDIEINAFNKESLRLSLVLSDQLRIPRTVRKETQIGFAGNI